MQEYISVQGCKVHNLKNIDVKDLLEKLKNSELIKDKKFLTKFGIYFGLEKLKPGRTQFHCL